MLTKKVILKRKDLMQRIINILLYPFRPAVWNAEHYYYIVQSLDTDSSVASNIDGLSMEVHTKTKE